MIEESYFDDDGLDRKFLNISSTLTDFFSWTYGKAFRLIAPLDPNKFDNASTKVKEVGIRSLIVLGAVIGFLTGTHILMAAVVLAVSSQLFRAAGFYFQKNGFTHVRGFAPEVSIKNGQATVMTWNIRGHGGSLYYEGGVIRWRSRVDRIVEVIQKESPDVLVLQEVYDTALVETLISKLENEYAHFYTHLGPNTWGRESGCMVITKCAVHDFTHAEFENNDPEINRGFSTLEIKITPTDSFPCARIIGTQLIPGKQDASKRVEQVGQIVSAVAEEKLVMPTLFVGSLHLDRDKEEKLLSKFLYHSYLDTEPTHSDKLVSQWAPVFDGQEESSDYISLFKRNVFDGKVIRVLPVLERNVRLIHSHLVKGFDDDYNTKTALSDHHAIVTTLSGLKECQKSQ